jgi:hypothetical protein
MKRPFLALMLLPFLPGCATKGTFPSLAPRAVERLSMEEPVRPVPVIPSDASLAGQIAELAAAARQGQSEFDRALPAARTAAAAAGGPGSESWIEAQQRLSRLEAARAPTVTALAELDALNVRRANVPTSPSDQAALRQATEAASALASDQQQIIDSVRASIGGG